MKQEQRHEIYNAIKTTLEWGNSNRCRNMMQRAIKVDIRVGINLIYFFQMFRCIKFNRTRLISGFQFINFFYPLQVDENHAAAF